MSLVLAGVGSETDLTAVSSLLRQGQSAVNLFTSDAARPELAERWESGLRALVEDAEPGSDHQLALVRAFATAASGPGHVREILGGALEGLSVDTDLRWTLVSALARLGDAEADEIAAELERDNTISGQESAAAALAIRPTAEAKAEAWNRAAVDPETPNETRRQIALAFQVAGQADVLEPYVDRYLELAETVIDDMGVWIGQVALIYLFPLANPAQATLDKVDAWLASTSAGAAATRYVSEGRDDLARALRAQQADRGRSAAGQEGRRLLADRHLHVQDLRGVLDLVGILIEGDAQPLVAVLAVDRRSERLRSLDLGVRVDVFRSPKVEPTPMPLAVLTSSLMPSEVILSSSTRTARDSVWGAFHWIGGLNSPHGSSSISLNGSKSPVAFASSTVMPTLTGPTAPGATTSASAAGSLADGESLAGGSSLGDSEPPHAPANNRTAMAAPARSLMSAPLRCLPRSCWRKNRATRMATTD